MKYFDAFTGIGGFTKAIQEVYKEKAECVGYSEIDKYACQIYQKHFPNHKNYGNISSIKTEELPDFDLLTFGFPCQSFSIAGKRGGFEDTRGTLFFEVARILKDKQPRFFIGENVKGLISHDNGKTLDIILETFQELGYYVNAEVYNSKDYGVPQNRERIFFIGYHLQNLCDIINNGTESKMRSLKDIIEQWLFQILLNGLEEVQKLQEQESKDWVIGYLISKEINQSQKLKEESTKGGTTIPMGEGLFRLEVEEVWQNIDIWLNKELGENLKDMSKSTISTVIKKTIDQKTYTYSKMFQAILLATVHLRNLYPNLWNEVLSNLILIQENTNYERINNRKEKAIITESGTAIEFDNLKEFSEQQFIGHLGGFGGRKVFPLKPKQREIKKGTGKTSLEWVADFRNDEGLRIKKDKIANTLLAQARQDGTAGQSIIKANSRIRRLTPTECERLQGFPDGWTEGVSDTQRYKCLGNAVTVNVVQAIIEKFL